MLSPKPFAFEALIIVMALVAMIACGFFARIDSLQIRHRLIWRVTTVTATLMSFSIAVLYTLPIGTHGRTSIAELPKIGAYGVLFLLIWLGGTLGYASVFWLSKQGRETTNLKNDVGETGNPYQPPSAG